MLLSNRQTIEDRIVEILAKRPNLEGPEIVTFVQKLRPNTTKQAVYSAMKFLLASEVISKAGKGYFVSRVWINKLSKLFVPIAHARSEDQAIFSMKDRESMTYIFPTLLAAERYWAHIFDLFMERLPHDQPIFVWNPHEWFVIARARVEREVFRLFETRKKFAYYTIHGSTPLDLAFRDNWQSKNVTVCVGSEIDLGGSYYLNIFGDFLLEVYLDERLAEKIDDLYQIHEDLDREIILKFESLIAERYRVKMRLSRNQSKAQKMRNRLSKEYLIY